MSAKWPKVKLGEVLRPISRVEPVDILKEYALIGVRLNGKGAFLREVINGTKTSAKTLYRVTTGDFIYSRLFAWRGAFDVIENNLDGCFVSGEFPTFIPIEKSINPYFLLYWFHLPETLDRVNQDCSGSTPLTRNRFKEQFFLELKIPLPPLSEQQRIVARIEELAAKIEEARSLNHQAAEEVESFCRSVITGDKKSKPTAMSELVRLRQPDVVVQPQESYQFAGVYCFGRGVFRGGTKTGMEFAYPRLTRLRTGDFLYPKLMAWEGAFGVVPEECNGLVVSTEFPVFEVDEAQVFPEVLDTYFRMPAVWVDFSGASTGTNVRRRRLNPKDFLAYRFPLPSRTTQDRLRKARVHADALKRLRSASADELDSLLPSILDKAFKGEL
ncbi:MAG: restriction endonuclease subunit S [Proteobacteria bacterium]|nr:restriction endonuclease subunit S [Pseudomonadota bacterium]